MVRIVHTVPLFNEIYCIRLGELYFKLEECDLVAAGVEATPRMGCLVSCSGIETRGWYAWNNLMPPKPDDLHIVGEVQVPNPGVDAELFPRPPKSKGRSPST